MDWETLFSILPRRKQSSIVFIHGFGGDRAMTWTWEGRQEAFLAERPPAASLSNDSNSFLYFFPFYRPKFMPEQLTIEDHSTALFQSLIGLREKTKTADRLIVFVCHSLGGLVCANALSRYHGTDVEKTIGVVFLGTPFKGSLKANWAGRALKVLDQISTTHKEDMNDLEERSAKLMHINDAFQKFPKARDRSETEGWSWAMPTARPQMGLEQLGAVPAIHTTALTQMISVRPLDREKVQSVRVVLEETCRVLPLPSTYIEGFANVEGSQLQSHSRYDLLKELSAPLPIKRTVPRERLTLKQSQVQGW